MARATKKVPTKKQIPSKSKAIKKDTSKRSKAKVDKKVTKAAPVTSLSKSR